MQIIAPILLLLFLTGCASSEDKYVGVVSEMNLLLNEIDEEIENSRHISNSKIAQKIIKDSSSILTLVELFDDTEEIDIYSDCQERPLNKGELAIILVDQIEGMPYYRVTGIQNCTMELCPNNPNGIEFYLGAIKRDDPMKFKEKYIEWFNSSDRKERR